MIFDITTETALEHISQHQTDPSIKVKSAKESYWKSMNNEMKISQLDYDWTFTPMNFPHFKEIGERGEKDSSNNNFNENQNQKMELEVEMKNENNNENKELINYKRLKMRNEPILWFDQCILWEDELADNGIAQLSIKCRVMSFGFLILIRHFLRVDSVTTRSMETRIYHEFEGENRDYLIMEKQEKRHDYPDSIPSSIITNNMEKSRVTQEERNDIDKICHEMCNIINFNSKKYKIN